MRYGLSKLLRITIPGILLTAALVVTAPVFSGETLKRRVLVLPFDNVLKNKNFAWMSESIADNLKTEILKSGRFEVLDVALLRKIDPGMQFANLDAKNASAFAQRLNCEVAVVGRFRVRKEGPNEIVNFEADGVDALEGRSVVVKNEEAPINAEIFGVVEKLAANISDELNQKLAPLDAASFKRDNKLEILIRRLEHPPTGFLDSLNMKNLTLKPAFDIDQFEYDVYLNYEEAAENSVLAFEYQYWGKRLTPHITATGMVCTAESCKVQAVEPVLNVAFNNKPNAVKYTIRFHYPDPRGPIVERWWVTAGYPYMQSISAFGYTNPTALAPGSGLTLDKMRGYVMLEAGLVPGRWQIIPAKIRWALATQSAYGNGDFPQYVEENPTKARVNMISAGGGLRFDRPFSFGKRYSLSPVLGIYVHYQRYFRDFITNSYNTMAINPELGLNQYYRLQPRAPWYFMLSLFAGSYLYQGQNLTYFRGSIGVEYVIK